MLKADDQIHFSASDLVGHLNCRYLTSLDLAVANGALQKPKIWDPVLEVLAERGAQHEQGYVEHLKATGWPVVAIDGIGIDSNAVAQTLDAMKKGAPIIVQGALQSDRWSGRADILRRVETASVFGAWSYEIVDTKLARETKGGTVLQICLYSNLLAAAQKKIPEFAYVVVPETGYEPQPFRLADYAAYYRRVRRTLENAIASDGGGELYPDPNPHCEICRWRLHCDDKRRADDHLSLVAGISKSQIGELKRRAVMTTAELAVVPLPLQWKPERGATQSYEKIREQARIQVKGRTAKQVIHETLPVVAGFGLTCLPAPSPGDVFLDLEGDPFIGQGGIEFLFGYAFRDQDGSETYTGDWALSRTSEKAAFERFVDFIIARLEEHPGLHIYHFAPYEPAALKRLMGRYATRENEIDQMLRAGLFVDLYAVVRHGIRASVESYSIKKLEPLYAFERTVALPDASRTLAKIQSCLEQDHVEGIQKEDQAAVQAYNHDDCLSTWKLRDWVEDVRAQLIKSGTSVNRLGPKTAEPSQDLSDWQKKIADLVARLTHDVPVDLTERTAEHHARWLLAHILDWHRREEKATWWEHFRLCDLSAEDLLEERGAISGLKYVDTVGGTMRAPIHRYKFPAQETELRGDEDLRSVGGAKFGTLVDISLDDLTIDIKKRQDTANFHAEAVYAHKIVPSKVLAEALCRIGEYVATNGISGGGRYQAARDLLLRASPLVDTLKQAGETTLDAAVRIAPNLHGEIFPVQGPPGAGKTHTGAAMICALVEFGKKVGITANSHKVIRNLLDRVIKTAAENGFEIRCIQRVREAADNEPPLHFTKDDPVLFDALATHTQVAAGTAWLWADLNAFEAVDVLFIDEAAQMSLANVLAVSQAAKSIVLLGDPRQLEQPKKGSHPEGTDVSGFDHILGGYATLAADRGLFLEETWRLHPSICAFTSELFYENRLTSRPGLELQTINSEAGIHGSGLRFIPVMHEGNQSSSPEEADKIREIVSEILDSNATWIDWEGKEAAIKLSDILIIAPYNAQVFELQERIPGARIGTVDKFQGQEAPIVIYSMTTSSHADAPRGMEFLYSSNRLNVATSRARCVCVIVGSTLVFEAECRTPRQMQLANAFCRYLEMATVI